MDANKKTFIIFIIVLVIILCSFVLMRFLPLKKEGGYSDNPKDWIINLGAEKEVDIEEASKGISVIDQLGLQYYGEEMTTVFTYDGWYKGAYFRDTAYLNGKPVMRIGNDMNINDDIIEGYIIERFEQDEPVIYIFLDEDWRNALPGTKIYWGKYFQNKMDFSFRNEIANGIYFETVKDDPARFKNGIGIHYGGVYVGELKEDRNSTLIRFN